MNYRDAVTQCWTMREEATARAIARGNRDLGLRAGVTSGAHLDPLSNLVMDVFHDAGIPWSSIHGDRQNLEIPGYYRPVKKWDVVVVQDGQLVAAVEFKSILGSYGNNMNNRTEEALGNAVDVLEAAEKGLLGERPPWLGYVFLMQDEEKSRRPVSVRQPHFPVDPDFRDASYQHRAEHLLRRLKLKRLYDAAWFVTADPSKGLGGVCEPAPDLSWAKFEAAIRGRVAEVLA